MLKVKISVFGICAALYLALAFAACGTSPATTQPPGRGRPAWVNSVDSVYGKDQYVAAVGTGKDRALAEKNALAALVSIFGQSIKVNQTVSTLYQDVVKSGVITSWSENNTMQDNITTAASMDTLVGAEIREVWDDSISTVYAVAVMEKTKTAQLYSDMIRANLNMINSLVTMTPAEKNTLGGYSRYVFAGAVADINVSFENVLKVIGAPVPAGVKSGFDYRKEASNIAGAIPIRVVVAGDNKGRIQGAFAKALNEMGFLSGGSNSRYVLDVRFSVAEATLPNPQGYKYARFVVDSSFLDTQPSRVVLLPYNIEGRSGHANISEAEERAVRDAVAKINDEYKDLLDGYLSRMLPKK